MLVLFYFPKFVYSTFLTLTEIEMFTSKDSIEHTEKDSENSPLQISSVCLSFIHTKRKDKRMPRGTYIKDLQTENLERATKIENALLAIQDLRAYLTSPKFFEDTTVQVRDVLNRLENVSKELF